MSELKTLPNIGSKLATELAVAGIETREQLITLGSLDASFRLMACGYSVCANKLYALEGAIRGIRWQDIPSQERQQLWEAFKKQRA